DVSEVENDLASLRDQAVHRLTELVQVRASDDTTANSNDCDLAEIRNSFGVHISWPSLGISCCHQLSHGASEFGLASKKGRRQVHGCLAPLQRSPRWKA